MAVLQMLSEKITVQIYEKVDEINTKEHIYKDWDNYLLPKTALIVELLALLGAF